MLISCYGPMYPPAPGENVCDDDNAKALERQPPGRPSRRGQVSRISASITV